MTTDHPHTHDEKPKVPDLKHEVAPSIEEEVLEELIDLEEAAKAGKPPRKAKRYRLRVDKEKFVVDVHEMTGRQILALVGKTPEKYLLSQKLHGGGVEPVAPDQVVEFHSKQIERFQTLARDPTEG